MEQSSQQQPPQPLNASNNSGASGSNRHHQQMRNQQAAAAAAAAAAAPMNMNIQNEVKHKNQIKNKFLIFQILLLKNDSMLVRNAVILLENEKVWYNN